MQSEMQNARNTSSGNASLRSRWRLSGTHLAKAKKSLTPLTQRCCKALAKFVWCACLVAASMSFQSGLLHAYNYQQQLTQMGHYSIAKLAQWSSTLEEINANTQAEEFKILHVVHTQLKRRKEDWRHYVESARHHLGLQAYTRKLTKHARKFRNSKRILRSNNCNEGNQQFYLSWGTESTKFECKTSRTWPHWAAPSLQSSAVPHTAENCLPCVHSL